MERQTLYCPKCEKDVTLVDLPVLQHEGQANLPDTPGPVCLEYNEACTQSPCPLCGVAGIMMGVRLAASDLKEKRWQTVRARCQACDAVADLKVLDRYFTFCPLCNTTNRWQPLADDGDLAALAGVR
jgi:hypothetical protein